MTDPDNTLLFAPVANSPVLTLTPTRVITFHAGGTEVLRLDGEGMTYKGQRVEDAGEAHRAFMEAMGAVLMAQSS